MHTLNTEINLLKRKERSYLLIIILLFISVMAMVVLSLFLQKVIVSKDIERHNTQISAFEAQILKDKNNKHSKQNLLKLQTDVAAMQKAAIPSVELYEEMIGVFAAPEQVKSYTNESSEEGSNQITIQADFANIDHIAAYLEDIVKFKYVAAASVTNISFSDAEKLYTADITIQIDSILLVEGLGSDE